MHNGQVTSIDAPRVTPVVYLDLDIAPDQAKTDTELVEQADEVCGTDAYAGLKALLLTTHGPGGGNPIYRIEGPLPLVIKWLQLEYHASEDMDFWLEQACLAR
jgi:hypothetical protein